MPYRARVRKVQQCHDILWDLMGANLDYSHKSWTSMIRGVQGCLFQRYIDLEILSEGIAGRKGCTKAVQSKMKHSKQALFKRPCQQTSEQARPTPCRGIPVDKRLILESSRIRGLLHTRHSVHGGVHSHCLRSSTICGQPILRDFSCVDPIL